MRASDQVVRNIDLSFDLLRQVLLRPDAADEIMQAAGGDTLVFIDPEDDALSAANSAMADRLVRRGEQVAQVEIQRRMFLHPVSR